jgi:hypothetical protein
MHEFEDCCIRYFENKDIDDDKQVRKILVGIKDMRVRDWITAQKDTLVKMMFKSFMDVFRKAYLPADWEESERRELGSMVQGDCSFWDFMMQVQLQNSLLHGTPSHLSEDKLQHRLEVGMNELLSKRCSASKVNAVIAFQDWLGEVKRVDDLMAAELEHFKEVTHVSRKKRRDDNVLSEPSRRGNMLNTGSHGRGMGVVHTGTRLPKLTEGEHQLLFNNEGCLKCRHFYMIHRSAECPNDFPTGANYRELTQADTDRWKNSKGKRVVAAMGANSENIMDDDTPAKVHLVTAVMGTSHPATYMPSNASNVIEGSDLDVSASDRVAAIAADDLAPLCVPHMWWDADVICIADEFPIRVRSLFDHGSHMVLIRVDVVECLTLPLLKLCKLECFELAMMPEGHPRIIELPNYVKLSLHDPHSSWVSKPVCAIVAPNLCMPIILGLPFLLHNNIVIDHATRTVIQKILALI